MNEEKNRTDDILDTGAIYHRIKENSSTLIFFFVVVVSWELVAALHLINVRIFPPPSAVLMAFGDVLVQQRPSLFEHLFRSIYHILIGYGIGVSLGIITGLGMSLNKYVYNFFNPILMILIPIPTLAWVPVLILINGLTDVTVIVAISLACYFPLVYNTLNGIRNTKKEYIWAARIMGAERLEVFHKILLPSASASIISGMRLAIGYSWRAMVGAEMLAALNSGLGVMMNSARFSFRVDILFAGILIIALGGMLADRLVLGEIENRTIVKWGMIRDE